MVTASEQPFPWLQQSALGKLRVPMVWDGAPASSVVRLALPDSIFSVSVLVRLASLSMARKRKSSDEAGLATSAPLSSNRVC